MKKKMVSVLLAAAMGTTGLVGFGAQLMLLMMFWNFTMAIIRMRVSGQQRR